MKLNNKLILSTFMAGLVIFAQINIFSMEKLTHRTTATIQDLKDMVQRYKKKQATAINVLDTFYKISNRNRAESELRNLGLTLQKLRDEARGLAKKQPAPKKTPPKLTPPKKTPTKPAPKPTAAKTPQPTSEEKKPAPKLTPLPSDLSQPKETSTEELPKDETLTDLTQDAEITSTTEEKTEQIPDDSISLTDIIRVEQKPTAKGQDETSIVIDDRGLNIGDEAFFNELNNWDLQMVNKIASELSSFATDDRQRLSILKQLLIHTSRNLNEQSRSKLRRLATPLINDYDNKANLEFNLVRGKIERLF